MSQPDQNKEDGFETMWILAVIICVAAIAIGAWMPTPFDPQPPAKLGKQVKAAVMTKLCFPEGIYSAQAHPYCEKYKDALFEQLNRTELAMAEKCAADGAAHQ